MTSEADLTSVTSRPSIVYYSNHGEFLQAKSLFGCKINSIFGNTYTDNVIACTDRGLYDLIAEKFISDEKYTNFSCGLSHCNALLDKQLYSWGEGKLGELGLSNSKTVVATPTAVTSLKDIVQINSGESFVLAVDSIGNLYSWGQNFDRQLGLYLKRIKDLPKNDSLLVEDVIYSPRLVPLSIKHPVKRIACGASYSICLTKSGSVYSWGEGLCGNLGTIKCTYQEIPTQVKITDENSEPVTIVDIACGIGHVISIDSNGFIFGWGLNKHGQLGLSDTNTRLQPIKITKFDGMSAPFIVKVYANGNSSACIDTSKKLYTWGASGHGRLLHDHNVINQRTHLSVPLLVDKVSECFDFTFAKKSSAIVVQSKAISVFPLKGPQKSMSKLTISGYGFYQSENVIVKFIKPLSHLAPRSCLGVYVNSTTIDCKPPRFNDIENYDVTISLDGKEFLPDTLNFSVYKEFSIVDMTPRIINRNTSSDTIVSIGFICKNMDPHLDCSITVKLVITEYSSSDYPTSTGIDTSNSNNNVPISRVIDFIVPGYFEEIILSESEDDESSEKIENKKKLTQVKCDVNLKDIKSDNLLFIQGQISLNGIDYCTLSSKTCGILSHCFNAKSIYPNCYPLNLSARSSENTNHNIIISGNSFIPSVLSSNNNIEVVGKIEVLGVDFPSGYESYSEILQRFKFASVTPTLTTAKSSRQSGFASALSLSNNTTTTAFQSELKVPLLCNTTNQIILKSNDVLEKVEMFLRYYSNIIKSSKVNSIDISVNFQLISKPTTDGEKSSLGDASFGSSLKWLIYTYFPIYSLPKLWRRQYNPEYNDLKIDILKASLAKTNTTVENTVDEEKAYEYIGLKTKACQLIIRNAKSSHENSILSYFKNFTCVNENADDDKSTTDGDVDKEDNNKDIEKLSYKIQFSFEDIHKCISPYLNVETSESADTMPTEVKSITSNSIYLDMTMNGISTLPVQMLHEIKLFNDLSIAVPINGVPKGGAKENTKITLNIIGEIPSDLPNNQCIVRLRGANNAVVDLTGDVDSTTNTITFTIPEASRLVVLKPEGKGKVDKKYYIDISIDDGFTFDKSSTTIIQLK